ncbi:MAG: hypothetical protein PHX61_07900 [Alphaproteobacteria bacterium]|nr:hypothetical protein [Alphaproteobacteria bacterium]
MKKIIQTVSFIFSLIATIFAMTYFMFLSQGKEEADFLNNFQRVLSLAGEGVAISDIVSEEWNTVCYVDSYTPQDQAYGVETNKANFYFALVFLNAHGTKKVLSFKPAGLNSSGLVMPHVELSGHKYRFLSKGKSLCLGRHEAVLRAVIVKTGCCGDSNEIIFTAKK